MGKLLLIMAVIGLVMFACPTAASAQWCWGHGPVIYGAPWHHHHGVVTVGPPVVITRPVAPVYYAPPRVWVYPAPRVWVYPSVPTYYCW